MENEFLRTKGFSGIAQDEEFREEVKRAVIKNYKYTFLVAPILFIIVGVVAEFLNSRSGKASNGMAAVVVAVIFVIVMICTVISFIKTLGQLKKPYADGIITKNKKWETYSVDKDGNSRSKRNYLIEIQTEHGKKIKIKDHRALAYHGCLTVGDKVRYHPGFPYPIEMFDKSRDNVNICVFCSTRNPITAGTCTKCKKRMLI